MGNKIIISITSIKYEDKHVRISYTSFPFYMPRVVYYTIEEIEQYIIQEEGQNATSIEFLIDSYDLILEDTITKFHFSQQAITFDNSIRKLKEEIKFLRNKLKFINH